MSDENDFVSWASNPARTNDELFTVELLIERMRAWQEWPFRDQPRAFEESMAAMKARKLNPAYRPALRREEIDALRRLAARVTHFNGGGSYDRPVRNVEALRFFPALEEIGISNAEVADFSPLAQLPRIRRLTLMEIGMRSGCHHVDLAQLGAMSQLELLWLSLHYPWPDVRALGSFPALRDLHFNGNILALGEVEALPEVAFADVSVWPGPRVPLRDLRALPAMPKLKRFTLKTTASLAGIERYPALVNLEVAGEFQDLTPLSAMANVTALTLTGEFFTDLAPLARMPKLRELHFISEHPLDLSPLTEAPTLRRVEFSRCAIMRTELSALNAGLLPEALDFLAEEPRPLGRLRFFQIEKENAPAEEFFPADGGNPESARRILSGGQGV